MSDFSPDSFEADLRPGSIDAGARDIGVDPADIFDIDFQRKVLMTKAGHLVHFGNIDADHGGQKDQRPDVLSSDYEVWEFNSGSLVSSKGREPRPDSRATFVDPWIYVDGQPRYANPICKWRPGNVTEAAYNDFRMTADPTGEGRGVLAMFASYPSLVTDPENFGGSLMWGADNAGSKSLRNGSFDGSRWSRITGDGSGETDAFNYQSNTPAAAGGTTRMSGNAVKLVSIALRYVNQDDVTLGLWSVTGGAYRLDVDVTFSTKTVTANTGTLLREEWYGDDIVVLVCLTSAVTASQDHYLQIVLGTDVSTSVEFTRPMVCNAIHEIPYTRSRRSPSQLTYPFEWTNEGTMGIRVRPAFQYTRTGNTTILGNRESSGVTTDYLALVYNGTSDKWQVSLVDDGSNSLVRVSTAAFTANSDFQKWHDIEIAWSVSAGTLRMWVDGTEQTDLTTNGSGIGSADISLRPLLRVGNEQDTRFDGWITDMWYSPVAQTASTVTARPRFSYSRQLGRGGSYRRDRWGHVWAARGNS